MAQDWEVLFFSYNQYIKHVKDKKELNHEEIKCIQWSICVYKTALHLPLV